MVSPEGRMQVTENSSIAKNERQIPVESGFEYKDSRWKLGENSFVSKDVAAPRIWSDIVYPFIKSAPIVERPNPELPLPVQVKRNLFPDWVDWKKVDPSGLRFSTRSCLAQAGVDINLPSRVDPVYTGHELGFFQDDIDSLSKGKAVQKQLYLRSLFRRIDFSEDLGRFFYLDKRDKVAGSKLLDLFLENKVAVEGQYGKDYCFINEQGEPLLKDVNSLEVKGLRLFTSNKRFHIRESTELIKIHSKKDLEDNLLPGAGENFINLCETMSVTLAQDVAGCLETKQDGKDIHLNSPLIDPGWQGPIRLELTESQRNYVDMFLYNGERS